MVQLFIKFIHKQNIINYPSYANLMHQSNSRSKSISESLPNDCFTPFTDCLMDPQIIFVRMLYPTDFLSRLDC
jgi:hypothetical protein